MITPEQLARSGSEEGHQKALFAWCALSVGTYPELRWLFHVPNGEHRDAITGAKLKAMGVKQGVPDLMLPVSRGRFHALFIEMKKMGSNTSPKQLEWIQFLRCNDYQVAVCYTWQEARQIIIDYFEGGNQ